MARFAWQPADTIGTAGFEPRRGSEESLPLLRQLIDQINLYSPLSINIDDYLAYIAVSVAISDKDAISKNYYLFLPPERIWRFFPWDRDTSFGNTGSGEYDSLWTESSQVYCFDKPALNSRLLVQENYRDLFNEYLLQTGNFMADELPFVIDSIYYEIRESVYSDPLKRGTNSDFDQAVAVLRGAVIERGQFLPEISGLIKALNVEYISLSEWDFGSYASSDSVTVTIGFSEPAAWTFLHSWTDGMSVRILEMNKDDINGYTWSLSVNFPADYEHLHLSVTYVAKVGSVPGISSFSYPLYGSSHPFRRLCAPTARRSSEHLNPDFLEILSPVRYTPFLWCIPIVNTSDITQDISFCGFQTGVPPARLFAGADILIMPGDTVFLTNNHEMLEVLLPGKIVLGDLVTDSPANTQLVFLYPSWETAIDITLGNEVSFYRTGAVLNELMAMNDSTIADNYGEYDDWLELANIGPDNINLSGYFLTDDVKNPFKFAFPDTVIKPGDYFIVWTDGDPEQGSMHAEFNMSSEGENIFLLYSLFLVDEIEFPALEGDASYGRWPDTLGEWNILAIPTPGTPNEGGPGGETPEKLSIQAPNPFLNCGIITIRGRPGLFRLNVYDLSGRLVNHLFEGEIISTGSLEWDVTSLPAGIYFLKLTSRGETVVQKITVIR